MTNEKDKFDALAKDMLKWADEDIDNCGRDILRRQAEGFAKRVTALANIVRKMRTCQRTYFRMRTSTALQDAKKAEWEVDEILKNADRPPELTQEELL